MVWNNGVGVSADNAMKEWEIILEMSMIMFKMRGEGASIEDFGKSMVVTAGFLRHRKAERQPIRPEVLCRKVSTSSKSACERLSKTASSVSRSSMAASCVSPIPM